MTNLRIFYVLTPSFTLLACVMLRTKSIQHLFTRHMFSVRTVQRYNLSHTTTKSTLLLFVSNDSSSHLYAISRSTSQRKDQHHRSCRNTMCSVFAPAANTHDTTVVFLWKASAVNVSLLND